MKIDNLYIIGGKNFNLLNKIEKNSKIVFFQKTNSEFDNQFLLIENFQKNQSYLRKKWLMFQDEVFKKIKIKLDKDKDFYYALPNLFFEASPNKTNSIYQFFKLYLILDFIKKENIKKVFLIDLSKEIQTFFDCNKDKFSFLIKVVHVHQKQFSFSENIKILEKKNFIFSIISCLVNEIKKIQKKKFYKKTKSEKIVLSYYYPGGHSFDNGFSSKFFEKVSNLLNNTYNWLFQYVGNTKSFDYENELINFKMNSCGFVDNYFSLIDFPKIILKFYKLRNKIKTIKFDNLFIFEEINYSSLFKSDWLTSNSILLLKLLIFENKISNFFIINPQIKEIIYLMEFQPWEQILNKVAKKYEIKTKGVIHSIARPNVMNYYHSKMIHPYLCLPNFVGANSDFSRSLLLKNGFSQDQVFKIEAQRYNYLFDTLDEINHKKIKNNNSILIFTSNILEETLEMLEMFSSSNLKFEKVYIKEHHLLPVDKIIKSLNPKFPSYEIIRGTVSEAFKYSDIVLIANGSSVLLESVIKRKITISLISLSTLPIPVVEEGKNLYFVYDKKSLSKTLSQLTAISNNYTSLRDEKNHLYLNKDLKLWREFLKK